MAVGGNVSQGTKHPVKIFANIFISFIGAGVLGLPFAFKEVCKYEIKTRFYVIMNMKIALKLLYILVNSVTVIKYGMIYFQNSLQSQHPTTVLEE